MKTIFWIAVIAFGLWYLFRHRAERSKRKTQNSGHQTVLKETTHLTELHLPVAKPMSKDQIWKFWPEDVFRKEYVSFSRIKTFRTCPKMFELIYLCGFEDKSGRAAQVGSLVHKIVQLYTGQHEGNLSVHLRNSGAVEELLNFYDQAVSSTDLTYSIPKSELRPYLNNFVVLNRKSDYQVQVIEHECDSLIGQYKLKCVIDRIDTGKTIIDYKTGKPQNVVNNQLNVYAYALSNGKWTPFQLVFQFLKTGEIRYWKYTAQSHRATEEWLLEGIQEIENTNFFRRTTSRLCDYCGVFEHCHRDH